MPVVLPVVILPIIMVYRSILGGETSLAGIDRCSGARVVGPLTVSRPNTSTVLGYGSKNRA